MRRFAWVVSGLALAGCGDAPSSIEVPPVAVGAVLLSETPSVAQAADGRYISWREHRIDDELQSGVPLRGSDGLVVADLDRDGWPDIVSVHESDDVYDGAPEGHIRIAFGSADPDRWFNVTLAEGPEAGAAEDVTIADFNGDGWLDVVAACELSHLIYFQNPGLNVRDGKWPRLIPSITLDRGSFIRVFAADFNGDGRPEVATPNKGAQDPTRAAQEPRAISVFEIRGEPLDDGAWVEHVLTEVPWPINAQAVDIDSDGDSDVVAGSVAQGRAFWFENTGSGGTIEFVEHAVAVAEPGAAEPPVVNAFNMDFADLNGDGRLDIVTFNTSRLLGIDSAWLEQPAARDAAWSFHRIGSYAPDQLVGFALADIDGDGDLDLMTGGYSGASNAASSRTADGVADVNASLGRLAWFEQDGDAWRRHDFSRRERGMFDKFVPLDVDRDGDMDFVGTRGNSGEYDGVFWLEQRRTEEPAPAFVHARVVDSPELPLPE